MKKLLIALLVGTLAMSFIGCGNTTQSSDPTQPKVTAQEEAPSVEKNEIEQKETVEKQEKPKVETQKEFTRQEKIQFALSFTEDVCKRNFDSNGVQSKVNYIHQNDVDLIVVTLKQEGLALSFEQSVAKNDFSQWEQMVASIVKCSGSNQKAVDDVVDNVVVQYQVLNDLNEDSVLIATLGGGLFYDISTEYRN